MFRTTGNVVCFLSNYFSFVTEFRDFDPDNYRAKCGHFVRPFDRHMYCFSCRTKPRYLESQTDACQKWADGTPGAPTNRCKVCLFATEEHRKLWQLPPSGTRPYKGQ